MDDVLLTDVFDQLVARLDGATPGLDDLRGRTLRRRRRARRRAGLAAAAVVVLVAAGAAWALPGDGPSERVDTGNGPTTTTAPAVVSARPEVATIGVVSDELAFQSCGSIARDVPLVFCRYDQPGSVTPVDGLTISVGTEPASAELRSAWARRDAEAVRALMTDSPDPAGVEARFTTVGGHDVVALGVTEVVSGASLGLPDRVARTYLLLAGEDTFQIGTEQVSEQQLGEVLGGLGPAPAEPGLDPAPSALPEGAQLVVQAEQPRWLQPEEFDPAASSPAPGRRYGGLFFVPGSRTPITVEVATGVDAEALLDGFSLRNVSSGAGPEPTGADSATIAGRRTIRLARGDVPETGLAFSAAGPSVIVAVDDATVVQVAVDRLQEDQLDQIAAAVVADLEGR